MNRELISNLPLTGGVYLLKDKDNNIIYIGKSINIKKRVQQHLRSKIKDKIVFISYIDTNSELDSLILEAKLIKKHLPKYNVLWRDDKQYPYIKISTNEQFPGIGISRSSIGNGAKYYGPFRGKTARELVKFLSFAFGIRRCNEIPLKKRMQPCLDYYTKRCKGPCAGKISRNNYLKIVSEIEDFFENGAQILKENLAKEMIDASKKKEFEMAAAARDKIKWLDQEINLYSGKFQWSGFAKASISELKKELKLKKLPKRIEAFDVSNIGSFETVASMVVFNNGMPYKKHYRRFKISLEKVPNDTLAIYESVFRRLTKTLAKQLPLPDLIVIDGGKGQLSSAVRAINDAKIKDLEIISMAKRMEEIFIPNRQAPIILPRNSNALKLLQNIRNEAHRFAVSYHRLRRSKYLLNNS